MPGFGQFCPVAVTCEIFAQRWTPFILRELLAGSHRFNQLQRGIPRIPRALLARRLRELEAAGVVTSTPLPAGRGRNYAAEIATEIREFLAPELGIDHLEDRYARNRLGEVRGT